MMKSLVNRAKFVLNSEKGGPQVETIVQISVALIVATALIALGIGMNSWIQGSQEQVETLSSGGELGWTP